MKKFEPLEENNIDKQRGEWDKDLLTSKLPKRAFTNPITSIFILMLEDWIKPTFKGTDAIRNWWKI